MLKHFTYTKDNGEMSDRVVYPLNIVDFEGVNEKLFSIDLTELSDKERIEAEIALDAIRQQSINAIRDLGLDNRYRYFFRRGINKK